MASCGNATHQSNDGRDFTVSYTDCDERLPGSDIRLARLESIINTNSVHPKALINYDQNDAILCFTIVQVSMQ